MKAKYLIPAILVLVSVMACANGQKETAGNETAPDYTTYTGLAKLLDSHEQGKDFFLIDVRTPEEYAGGHIPSALLLPYDTISTTSVPTAEKNALIILYCRSGARAGTAMRTLESLGYTNVHNFGGVAKWEGPLTAGSDP